MLKAVDRKVLNRAVYGMFNSPDGQMVLEFLERNYSGNLLKKGDNGHTDPIRTGAAIGQDELVKTLKRMIADGQLAR